MRLAKLTAFFLLVFSLYVSGQPTGQAVAVHVTDDNGQPLAGITVQIKGTQRKYVTNAAGDLTINNVPPGAVLIFTGVNVEEMEMAVGGKTELTTHLKTKVAALEDAVVTGFQRIDRKKFT